MSRLSIRPRPLDIHKRLPIVKTSNDYEDDETPVTNSTRNFHHYRLQVENDNEVHQTHTRKKSREIPTPQCSIVDTYENNYCRTFIQSTSYIRGRGARAEISEFVEYDLDNEDEDWLEEFNNERKALTSEKFEALLFKLEVMDHKARERAGLVVPTFGSPVPVLLHLDAAAEALHFLSVRLAVFESVFNYWKAKRERWQKPILRRLQPPPPVSDTNPYNVFRPREKAHRLHTRRRRENNVQSFEKLRQVRRSLDQAKKVLEAMIKREEKKREVIECEVNLQQLQMKYMMAGDGMEFPSFQDTSCQSSSSDEDYIDSDDTENGYPQTGGHSSPHLQYAESKLVRIPTFRIKRELKRSPLHSGWMQKRNSDDPVLLFMKPLDVDKLAAVGIVHPSDPPAENGSALPPYRFHGRIGRGGRIIFDRCNPLLRASDSTHYVAPNSRPSPPNG